MQTKFRDRAPRLVHEINGQKGDFLLCPPLNPFNPAGFGNAGVPPEEHEKFARAGYAACRPGSWDPAERLKDMDIDGLYAEVIYGGFGMALFGHPDEEFQRDAHRAYNDWASEYASYAPSRLVPVANISMTDPVEDLKELHRVHKMGFRGIFISNDPLPKRRYDNRMWEPFWTAVEEYGMPVNIHILTAQDGKQFGSNAIVDSVLRPVSAFRTIAEMITGGVLERHPNLKIVSAENDIGWLPSFLKRFDWYSYRFKNRYPIMKLSGGDYWRRQVYATFQDDIPGVLLRDMIGVTQLLWGSDYPHFDSTFPKSREAVARNFVGVPADEMDLIVSRNTARLYGLEEALN